MDMIAIQKDALENGNNLGWPEADGDGQNMNEGLP